MSFSLKKQSITTRAQRKQSPSLMKGNNSTPESSPGKKFISKLVGERALSNIKLFMFSSSPAKKVSEVVWISLCDLPVTACIGLSLHVL